ncbi:iron complex transport system permease protein [Nocardioides terrae]|uniref:Iron complex transport system permease protein n=1 Tax=Nocardioides terrae TaxID=574651 RepID=A0A1I1ETI4_9ACTN|nr:iron ABC transporter permease [Nocardioides terrae]SFB90434.1 iron complex transport system permease protein [Nocardioides terrae]
MSATVLGTPPAAAATRHRAAYRSAWLLLALLVVALAALASVAVGVAVVGWDDVVRGLSGDDATLGAAAVAKRVPRTVLALLVGGALGLSGAVMQGVTRNPLADPAILGITNGASLAVVSGIAFFGLASPTSYVWVAIGGAAATAVFVYAVGSMGRGGATPLKLALAGAATAAASSSLVSAVLLPRLDVMTQFRFWQVGGVGGAGWDRIGMMLPFLGVGTVVCLASARGLNSLALGDDVAAGLGEHVARTRLVAGVAAVVLCGAATATAGPIAFVGLMVPHACRLLVGVDHRWLLPASFVVGGGLLTLADVVGRVVARPEEVEVGIVTALIGAPVFVWIVRRTRVRAL